MTREKLDESISKIDEAGKMLNGLINSTESFRKTKLLQANNY